MKRITIFKNDNMTKNNHKLLRIPSLESAYRLPYIDVGGKLFGQKWSPTKRSGGVFLSNIDNYDKFSIFDSFSLVLLKLFTLLARNCLHRVGAYYGYEVPAKPHIASQRSGKCLITE